MSQTKRDERLRQINAGLQVLRGRGAATAMIVDNHSITAKVDFATLGADYRDLELPMVGASNVDWAGSTATVTYAMPE